MQARSASAEVQQVLPSTSSISILSSVVAMSVALRRRPPRPSSSPPSPRFHLRTAATTQRAVQRDKQTVQTHSSRIERRAVRHGGGTGAGERRPASAGGMREAGSALGLRRLEAPVCDKPGIDQHQRRTLRPDMRDIGNDSTKRSDAWRLCVTKRRLNRSERWPRAEQSEIRTEFILQESHQI